MINLSEMRKALPLGELSPKATERARMLFFCHSGRPDLSLSDVRTALLSSVHKLAPLKGKTAYGGILDVAAAMKWGR